jgi:hypothetical protein
MVYEMVNKTSLWNKNYERKKNLPVKKEYENEIKI